MHGWRARRKLISCGDGPCSWCCWSITSALLQVGGWELGRRYRSDSIAGRLVLWCALLLLALLVAWLLLPVAGCSTRNASAITSASEQAGRHGGVRKERPGEMERTADRRYEAQWQARRVVGGWRGL